MPSYFGLYHPYIHFQDEGWLKVAALYWDGIYRMVPGKVVPEDSSEVKKLIDAGFIHSRHPGMGAHEIEEPFRHLIADRGAELGAAVGVQGMAWEQLDHIHTEKIEKVAKDLISCGLAVRSGPWLGMHPRLANVYMTALAEAMATQVGARPLAERTTDHVAVAGLTVERLAEALLDQTYEPRGRHEIESLMASVSLGYVLPKNPASIPAEQIIRFREAHAQDRGLFQKEIGEIVAGLDHLQKVSNPADVRLQLEAAYKETLEGPLERLKVAMKTARWDTVEGTLATSFSLPRILAAALDAIGAGGLVTAGGIALSGWKIWRKHERAIANVLKPSAETFLYRVESALTPQAVAREIPASSRRFAANS